MELLRARYVMGRTLDLDGPGAVVHVRADAAALGVLEQRLAELGPCSRRSYAHHVAFGVRGSPDIVEALADAMEALVLDPAASPSQLLQGMNAGRRPNWIRLQELARARGLPVLLDDEGLSIGVGASSATFGMEARPSNLDGLATAPVAMVTGTNGKTTTTRFLAAMAQAEGHTVGHTSSDGIFVGEQCIERGDWSGPGAARRILRHGRVRFAVLETARGGMLRRGVQVDFADAAVVTNVSADHLGEWGVQTVDDMAEVKLLVGYALRSCGVLVLNADQWRWPALLERFRAERPDVVVRWFSTAHEADAWVQDGGVVVDQRPLLAVNDIPLTFGGRAAHNIENALGAALAGVAMGLPLPAIAAGLRAVTPDPEHSAGRANAFTVAVPGGEATVFVDFAHNPEGMRHLAMLARTWGDAGHRPVRRLLLIGQAGDRSDAVLDATTRAALEMAPAHVYLKEMVKYLRGRQPGEVTARMHAIFAASGVQTSVWADELAATDAALGDLRDGDFLLLLAHTDAGAVVERVRARVSPAVPLPL